MAVLGDLPIPYRVGACCLIYQDGAPALRERDRKQANVWGQRATGNGQGDMADKRVGAKAEAQGREGARPGE